ncbi:hypothetical protein BDN72DRAFT_907004 [Pluteus cervinus]|uniref:Uncharacterized protein n=1 Tax=Pluteus cervinus TaxID=181527 RepID=A0ACD2ZYD8_9AGAR|nr:hypothetical protein BDN72DRAFT_907004 [Pluteus cervinus]
MAAQRPAACRVSGLIPTCHGAGSAKRNILIESTQTLESKHHPTAVFPYISSHKLPETYTFDDNVLKTLPTAPDFELQRTQCQFRSTPGLQ